MLSSESGVDFSKFQIRPKRETGKRMVVSDTTPIAEQRYSPPPAVKARRAEAGVERETLPQKAERLRREANFRFLDSVLDSTIARADLSPGSRKKIEEKEAQDDFVARTNVDIAEEIERNPIPNLPVEPLDFSREATDAEFDETLSHSDPVIERVRSEAARKNTVELSRKLRRDNEEKGWTEAIAKAKARIAEEKPFARASQSERKTTVNELQKKAAVDVAAPLTPISRERYRANLHRKDVATVAEGLSKHEKEEMRLVNLMQKGADITEIGEQNSLADMLDELRKENRTAYPQDGEWMRKKFDTIVDLRNQLAEARQNSKNALEIKTLQMELTAVEKDYKKVADVVALKQEEKGEQIDMQNLAAELNYFNRFYPEEFPSLRPLAKEEQAGDQMFEEYKLLKALKKDIEEKRKKVGGGVTRFFKTIFADKEAVMLSMMVDDYEKRKIVFDALVSRTRAVVESGNTHGINIKGAYARMPKQREAVSAVSTSMLDEEEHSKRSVAPKSWRKVA